MWDHPQTQERRRASILLDSSGPGLTCGGTSGLLAHPISTRLHSSIGTAGLRRCPMIVDTWRPEGSYDMGPRTVLNALPIVACIGAPNGAFLHSFFTTPFGYIREADCAIGDEPTPIKRRRSCRRAHYTGCSDSGHTRKISCKSLRFSAPIRSLLLLCLPLVLPPGTGTLRTVRNFAHGAVSWADLRTIRLASFALASQHLLVQCR